MTRKVKPLLLMCALGAGIGLFFIGNAVRFALATSAAHRWQRASGQIISFEIKTTGSRKSCDIAVVRYSYVVQRSEHLGNRVSVGDTCLTKDEASELQSRLVAGRIVDVYFDPQQPAFAVLERGKVWANLWIGAALGSVLLVAALSVGVREYRQ